MEDRLSKIAGSLADNLHMEAMIRVRVGYGNVVTQLPEIAESYQEARMALEVGHVFYAKYDTISYGKLGIGRLIYQLPMSLCNMFIKEVFGEKIPDILDDEEAMSTINKFFENNLIYQRRQDSCMCTQYSGISSGTYRESNRTGYPYV